MDEGGFPDFREGTQDIPGETVQLHLALLQDGNNPAINCVIALGSSKIPFGSLPEMIFADGERTPPTG